VLRIRPFSHPGSGSIHFLIPDPSLFSSRILHKKWKANLLFSCFLCFQEQSLNPINAVRVKNYPLFAFFTFARMLRTSTPFTLFVLGTAINITFRILSPYQRIIINSRRDLYTMLKSARHYDWKVWSRGSSSIKYWRAADQGNTTSRVTAQILGGLHTDAKTIA
jgi:hypothetical protein